MTNKNTPIGILGAGITGLSIAYGLHKKGIPVTVYEKSNQVGGAIKTIQEDGWLVEEGPNTLMVKSEQLWKLLDELDLQNQIIEANTKAKRRFIVKDSQPVALPSSISALLRTSLLTTGAKVRLLKEPFISPSQDDDETIARFISRRLGQEPLNYGINPFVSGVYAGDPAKLSIRHTFSSLWEMEQTHGSLLKGIIKKKKQPDTIKRKLLSFKDGNQTLPRSLASVLPNIKTSCEITSANQRDAVWQLNGREEGTPMQAEHDIIIPTLPAYQLASIFDDSSFTPLSDIPYAPLSIVALGFKKEQIHHPLDGFGMLIPEVEPFQTLGVLFSSTLFSDRAPENHHLLTCFIGGARYPHLAQKSKAELLKYLLPELDQLLGIEGNPVFTHHTFWPKAIPQYNVGYEQYLSAIKNLEKKSPGLFINGNFRGGVSVPDCIFSGLDTANKVADYLK
ncbi:protoporphyrinogen oxidase [Fodinibius salsisoli]|uniref:Coproporphyrinogen III oxidase n=1 Tax=Fodinibius salsisoli TaxID=2820877 RepID=A0ABT3PMA3_9BACT|nr:protoporphyrinogen oxidase [Fodinibius salsisoli]MCW9707075.1 protoporphyrinogen oxidase [Fodinibius salsisoli]